jgi:streptogramin lyase
MWIFPKYKTNLTFGHAQGQYGAFNKNVRRNWGVWPMFVSSTNYKGFQATASTIVYDDNGRIDGRTLWVASTFSNPINATPVNIFGSQWNSCDFDDEGYTYFSGSYGTTKRGIMDKNQIWVTQSAAGNTDYVVRYNNGGVYVGSQNSSQALRKYDKSGNFQWSVGLTGSRVYSIDFDESNNIYVCGIAISQPGVGIIAKYNESGTQIWSAWTDTIMYDLKYFSNQLYIGCQWDNNTGSANDGAIHLRSTDGVDLGYFGNELRNRNTSAGNGYYAIEVSNQYVIGIDEEGSTQGLDVYNRNLNSLTASLTASVLPTRMKDLEFDQDGNFWFCDYDTQRIYRLNATFSRIEENFQVGGAAGGGLYSFRMKKTY